MKTLKWTC